MGAETSILENCEIGAKLPLKADVDWVVQEAVQKSPNLPRLALFTKKKKDRRREVDVIALNAKVRVHLILPCRTLCMFSYCLSNIRDRCFFYRYM